MPLLVCAHICICQYLCPSIFILGGSARAQIHQVRYTLLCHIFWICLPGPYGPIYTCLYICMYLCVPTFAILFKYICKVYGYLCIYLCIIYMSFYVFILYVLYIVCTLWSIRCVYGAACLLNLFGPRVTNVFYSVCMNI